MKLSAFSIFCNPAVLGVALASGLVLCACGDPQAKSSETARVPAEVIVPTPRPESPDVWRAPAFEFTDQNGSPVNLASLSGRVWIANFVFTQCTTICPTLSAKMALLRRRLPQQDLRFVSFSVDPAHDDEAALTAYAARFGPPDPRWILC